MKAAMVAVPTPITAEVLIPATIEGAASGSSIKRKRAKEGRPRARADSWREDGIEVSPLWVLRTIGRSE